jgi:hypothetical protein
MVQLLQANQTVDILDNFQSDNKDNFSTAATKLLGLRAVPN